MESDQTVQLIYRDLREMRKEIDAKLRAMEARIEEIAAGVEQLNRGDRRR